MAEQSKLKLLYLVLCDGFSTEPNTGKKSFLGVFDRIIADAFPIVFPSLMIAVGLEGGDEPFEIGSILQDPGGKEIFRSPTIPVTPKPPYRREDIIVQINGLRLERAGRFEVLILVNGPPLWAYPLYVEQKATTQQVVTSQGSKT